MPIYLNPAMDLRLLPKSWRPVKKKVLPQVAWIDGQPNSKNVVPGWVPSFTVPGTKYRIAFNVDTQEVHCNCDSFYWKNRKQKTLPRYDAPAERLCKHLHLCLHHLIADENGEVRHV